MFVHHLLLSGDRRTDLLRLTAPILALAAFVLACESSPEPFGGAPAEVEIVEPGPLLDADGRLAQRGWSRQEMLHFNRDAVAAAPEKLRRWDFFGVMNETVTVDLTVADIGFISVASATVTEFKTGKTVSGFAVRDETEDIYELSDTAHGLTRFIDAGASSPILVFEPVAGGRRLTFAFPADAFSSGVTGELNLAEPEGYQYLALATPFTELPTQFFYEQKIPGMRASGIVVADGVRYDFDPASAFAVLDWGRGVWPDEIFWQWGQAAGSADGVDVALNIGGGYGDMSSASANIVIYDGKAHKLGRAAWTYDEARPYEPWRFESDDGRMRLTLEPFHVDDGGVNLGSRWAEIHKAYGWMTGTLTLDNGTVLRVRLLGFAEQVRIKWG